MAPQWGWTPDQEDPTAMARVRNIDRPLRPTVSLGCSPSM